MYYIVWNYTVQEQERALFEQEYGPSGSWFKFFETCDDYLGSDLLADMGVQGQYLLIDKWISRDAYESFLAQNKAEYDRLNDKFQSLHTEETRLGSYQALRN